LYHGLNIQLVSYARTYEEFEKRAARIAGISMHPTEHNEAMIEKHALPFPLLGDSNGDHANAAACGTIKSASLYPPL
jgi:peroxiredoxin